MYSKYVLYRAFMEDLFVSLTIINYFYAKYPNKGMLHKGNLL
jgi:hypothetical protein